MIAIHYYCFLWPFLMLRWNKDLRASDIHALLLRFTALQPLQLEPCNGARGPQNSRWRSILIAASPVHSILRIPLPSSSGLTRDSVAERMEQQSLNPSCSQEVDCCLCQRPLRSWADKSFSLSCFPVCERQVTTDILQSCQRSD